MNIIKALLRKNEEKRPKYLLQFPDTDVKHLIFFSENKFIVGIDKKNDLDWETKENFDKIIEQSGKIKGNSSPPPFL